MNFSRIAGLAAAGAAAALALSGCIPLPSAPQVQPTPTTTSGPTPTTTPGTTESPEPTEEAGGELVDTQWTGVVANTDFSIDLEFTFEDDGTLYITHWSDETGVPFDSPLDTWSLDGDTLSITLSQIQDIETIDLTGTYAAGAPLQMTGVDGLGATGYAVTFTQG